MRHALSWMEYEKEDVGSTRTVGRPHRLHVIQSTELGVEHLTFAPDSGRYVYPTSVRTTAQEFQNYLANRLAQSRTQHDAQIYALLGVALPVREEKVPVPQNAQMAEDLEELYRRAATAMSCKVAELREKYGHLNVGLQSMNLRNRLRAKGKQV